MRAKERACYQDRTPAKDFLADPAVPFADSAVSAAAAGPVAGSAILQLGNLAAGVDLLHPRRLVLVAIAARVGHEVLGGELLLGGVVTGNAPGFSPTCTVVDRKDVDVGGAAPGMCRMTI